MCGGGAEETKNPRWNSFPTSILAMSRTSGGTTFRRSHGSPRAGGRALGKKRVSSPIPVLQDVSLRVSFRVQRTPPPPFLWPSFIRVKFGADFKFQRTGHRSEIDAPTALSGGDLFFARGAFPFSLPKTQK